MDLQQIFEGVYQIQKQISALQQDVNELRTEMQQFKVEIRAEMQQFKDEMRTEMQQFKAEMRTEMQQFKAEMCTEMQQFKAEMNTRFEEQEINFEELRDSIDLLVEKKWEIEKELHQVKKRVRLKQTLNR
ncbi:hypothetical protein LSG31_18795 [Fodinisporobacter ferrooxydans]|uniref:DUF1640 domain-containing protein n=1 Tax=Fodinisporobacter ferrooxydans TaxID=2901836 RepID=A0ABY4CKB3_9BACL|nr:hypothetical protein LSG31_18795 [Alicyclobacillaceae bacterium MYW30-H2]